MVKRITKACTRTYSDTGQVVTYVEWLDARGVSGRTEGAPNNLHMFELLARAEREGVAHTREVW